MTTIIPHPKPAPQRSFVRDADAYRAPHFDCENHTTGMKLTVYVPGVDASGVEILLKGADLEITARKAHYIRVNWQALHLEGAQRDYRLRLRIGGDFNAEAMHAELVDGVLTIELPKYQPKTDERVVAGAGERGSPLLARRSRRLARHAA